MKKILVLIVLSLNLLSMSKTDAGELYYLYVGTYTTNEEEGIAIYKFDASDGSLEYQSTASGITNPSYLAIHPGKKLLLAVNEIGDYEGARTGAISSFKIRSDGSLKLISQVATGGGAPCYVSVDSKANYALVANYSGGNVGILPINVDGVLEELSDLEQHVGSGPNQNRQGEPHAHAFVLDPSEQFGLAVDLGMDRVISYRINKNEMDKRNEFKADAGAGPRHLTFHPNEKFVFIINELNSTISSCSYDDDTGALMHIMTVNTLPEDYSGENSCADIHVSGDGKFLYGSNRGHDSIVVYAIDEESGDIQYRSHHSVEGQTPRNFMIDPTDRYLLVANQNSNNIVVFQRDSESGELNSTGVHTSTSKPVCLKMLKIK
jgi:6-phosphogluconolactonase